MKTCASCFAEHGILADYCMHCGTELPAVELSEELEEEKEEHNRFICLSAFGHTLQLSSNDDAHYCTACGNPLPVSPSCLH